MLSLETMREKPIIGWSIAGVLGLIAAALLARWMTGSARSDALSEKVLIVYQDTNERAEVSRGWIERELLVRSAAKRLDPGEGLVNPATSKPSGFPEDRAYWKKVIESINTAREEERRARAGGSGSHP